METHKTIFTILVVADTTGEMTKIEKKSVMDTLREVLQNALNETSVLRHVDECLVSDIINLKVLGDRER